MNSDLNMIGADEYLYSFIDEFDINIRDTKLYTKIYTKFYTMIHIVMSDYKHDKSYQLKLNYMNYHVN